MLGFDEWSKTHKKARKNGGIDDRILGRELYLPRPNPSSHVLTFAPNNFRLSIWEKNRL